MVFMKNFHPENTEIPALTLSTIEHEIDSVLYYSPADNIPAGVVVSDMTLLSMQMVTICTIVLKNGFVVTDSSACLDPKKFNLERGKQAAYGHAINQLFKVMAYGIKDHLHNMNLIEQIGRDAFTATTGCGEPPVAVLAEESA